MSNTYAVPVDIAAVFGNPGDCDSSVIFRRLVALKEGGVFDTVLLGVFEWVYDIVDSSINGLTEEEQEHLLTSIALVVAIVLGHFKDKMELAICEGVSLVGEATSEGDDEYDCGIIPGFYPQATDVELSSGWRLYIPMGVGVPTLRHTDDLDGLVVPLPARTSWETLTALSDLESSGERTSVTVLLTETLRLYAERDGAGEWFQFRYWNAFRSGIPFTLSASSTRDLISSVRNAILWLSVYSVGPDSEDDILWQAASEFVAGQPMPRTVDINADPFVWQAALTACRDDFDEASATFFDYDVE